MIQNVERISPETKVSAAGPSTPVKAAESALEKNTARDAAAQPKSSPDALSSPDVKVILNGEEQKQAEKKEKEALEEKDVKDLAEQLNEYMSELNCNLQFNYYEKLGRLGVKMINRDTQEIIKEFPPEKLLEAMEKTKEWIGMFLDKKV